MRARSLITLAGVAISLALGLYLYQEAKAHCDTLDGPVVMDARRALEKGDVTPVLKWVGSAKEAEIREAFKKTMVVRSKGAEAQDLADMYFFETLVRIHREGEGAPYTGLKAAGEVEPSIAAADRALETGSAAELMQHLNKALTLGVKERFEVAITAKKHAEENVAAGREYVAAYVTFIHYVEQLHNDITRFKAHEHVEAPAPKAEEGHRH